MLCEEAWGAVSVPFHPKGAEWSRSQDCAQYRFFHSDLWLMYGCDGQLSTIFRPYFVPAV